MSSEPNGRLVEVKTKFHSEATKPGGVNRSGAKMAADRSVTDIRRKVEEQLDQCLGPLVETLRLWPSPKSAEAIDHAARIRDLAGLADLHLLTEVAMHTFDCLHAVVVDGATIERAEAICFADALTFAQQPLCRGSDLEPYRPLLHDLEALTTLVIERSKPKAKTAPSADDAGR